MQRLQQVLERGNFVDSELQDLETRFLDRHKQYVDLLSQIEAEGDGESLPANLNDLLYVPKEELLSEAAKLRSQRRNLIEQVTATPKHPCELRLVSERIRQEVVTSAVPCNDAESIRSFMHRRFLRRCDSLGSQLAMVNQRMRCHVRDVRVQEQLTAPLKDATGLIEKEVDCARERVNRLRPSAPSAATKSDKTTESSTPVTRSDLTVLIREVVEEDRMSRTLRHFIARLQYLPFSNRNKIWRRAVELGAAADSASTEGLHDGSPQVRVPTAILSKKHLDQQLQELGEAFGCHVSLRTDKGHAFAHQIAMDFPQNFTRQQRRMDFAVYPVGSLAAEKAAEEVGSAQNHDHAEMAPEGGVVKGRTYIKPSDWTKAALWRARVDASVIEQNCIMKASFQQSHNPLRTSHARPSYARQMLEIAYVHSHPIGDVTTDGVVHQRSIDGLLQAEKNFLEVADVKIVARRLHDLSERPAAPRTDEEQAALDASQFEKHHDGREIAEDKNSLPSHLRRAYYMLRHLQSRTLRRKLLGLLNFFRFVQQKLVFGASLTPDSIAAAASEVGTSTRGSKKTTARMQWNLSARQLSEQYRACSLPLLTEPSKSSSGPLGSRPPASGWAREASGWEHIEAAEDGERIIIDENRLPVIHAAALEDLVALEEEMLTIGSYFTHKFEAAQDSVLERPTVDRAGVLLDLFTSEVWYNSAKQKLLEVYLEIYEHTADLRERKELTQRIVDVMAMRPRLDLEEDYFADAYAHAICVLEARTDLLSALVKKQVSSERKHQRNHEEFEEERRKMRTRCERRDSDVPAARRFSQERRGSSMTKDSAASGEEGDVEAVGQLAHTLEGYPWSDVVNDTKIRPAPTAQPVGIMEFSSAVCMAWKAEVIIEESHRDLVQHFHPKSMQMVTVLERACYMIALKQWSEWLKEIGENDVDNESRNDFPAVYENPELLAIILDETALKLQGTQATGEEEGITRVLDERIADLEIDATVQREFAELRRKRHSEALLQMTSNLLEHLRLRGLISDVALEVRTLEKALGEQASLCSLKLESLRQQPMPEFVSEMASQSTGNTVKKMNTWIHASGLVLTAGELDVEMSEVDISSSKSLVLHCASSRLTELRLLYQHEVAYRDLIMGCVQHNALILDAALRQKELQEVGVVGPPLWLTQQDIGPQVMLKLRATAALSSKPKSARKAGGEPVKKGSEQLSSVDTSRVAHLFQSPPSHKAPVRGAVSQLFRDKGSLVKKYMHNHGMVETERILRQLKYRFLAYSSLFHMQSACDLAVRVQAAHSALRLREVSALVPTDVSPFEKSQEKRRPFVDKEGNISGLFNIPTGAEVLAMRGVVPQHADVTHAMTLMDNRMPSLTAAQAGDKDEKRGEGRTGTPGGKAGRASMKAQKTKADLEETEVSSVPQLEIEYGKGNAFVVMRLLHEMVPLISLLYFIHALNGDRLSLLRLQRKTRFSLADYEKARGTAASVLSRADPTYEALQRLQTEFDRLQQRIQALGEDSKDPAHILRILSDRLSSAHWQVAVILRRAAQMCLQGADLEEFAEVHHWVSHLNGDDVDTVGLTIWPAAMHSTPSPATLSMWGCETRNKKERVGGIQGSETFAYFAAQGRSTDLELPVSVMVDGDRYMKEFHPSLPVEYPYPHPFMHELVKRYSSKLRAFDGADSAPAVMVANNPVPLQGITPWIQPRVPLVRFTSALCLLTTSQRQKISKIRLDLEATAEQYRGMCSVFGSTVDSADAELFKALLVLEKLRECVLCARLMTQPPATREELHQFENHFHTYFGSDKCFEKEEKDAAKQDGKGQGKGKDGAAAEKLKKEAEMLMSPVGKDISLTFNQIGALTVALNKLLLSFSNERLGRELALLSELGHRRAAIKSSRPTSYAAGQGSVCGSAIASLKVMAEKSSSGQTRDPFAAKVDSVICFLNQLRARGTFVQTHRGGKGDRAYVFTETDLDECIEALGRDLVAWGDEAILGRQQQADALAAHLRYREEVLNERLNRQVVESTWFFNQMDARIDALVADRSYRLIFEVDRLHRVVRNLKAVSREMEYRLNSEIRQKVSEEIAELNNSLMGEKGRFKEYKGDMFTGTYDRLRKIRQAVTDQLAELGAQNHALDQRAKTKRKKYDEEEHDKRDGGEEKNPRRTVRPGEIKEEEKAKEDEGPKVLVVSKGMQNKLKDVEQRDDPDELRQRIQDLKDAQIRARAFYALKIQAMRQKFDQQMQALAMTLASNSELWDRLSEVSDRERLAEGELASTSQAMSLCESLIEKLKAQVEFNVEQRTKLQTWKRNKSRRLEELENEVKKYDRSGTLNVEKSLQELQEKDARVKELQEKGRAADRGNARAAMHASAETSRMKEDLKAQNEEKAQAFEKLTQMRKELEAGGMSEESRLDLWRERTREAAERLQRLEAENKMLKQLEKAQRSGPPTVQAQRPEPALYVEDGGFDQGSLAEFIAPQPSAGSGGQRSASITRATDSYQLRASQRRQQEEPTQLE